MRRIAFLFIVLPALLGAIPHAFAQTRTKADMDALIHAVRAAPFDKKVFQGLTGYWARPDGSFVVNFRHGGVRYVIEYNWRSRRGGKLDGINIWKWPVGTARGSGIISIADTQAVGRPNICPYAAQQVCQARYDEALNALSAMLGGT